MVESASEVCSSVRVGCGNLKCVWWNDQVKAAVKRKRCWELEMKMQGKGFCKSTKRKREGLKGAFIEERKRSRTVWREDESRYEWKLEIVLEGGVR